MAIRTRPATKEYRDNFDSIFKRPEAQAPTPDENRIGPRLITPAQKPPSSTEPVQP